jgi:hypothetical protein
MAEYNAIKKFINEDIMKKLIADTHDDKIFKFNEALGNFDVSTVRVPRVPYIPEYYGINFNIDNSNIKYKMGRIDISGISIIDSTHKIATGLFIAYINANKQKFTSTSSISPTEKDSKYKFRFDDDGSVVVIDNDKELPSMTVAIKKYLKNDASNNDVRLETCKKIFGDGINAYSSPCINHFAAILGRAGYSMLNNIGQSIDTLTGTHDVRNALKTADVGIKYEILKNLDWKMKISNGKKTMVSVDEWLQRIEQDNRPLIKAQATQFRDYFNVKPEVKILLEDMINDINNNSRLLDEKYKEAVEQKTGNLQPSKMRKRLSPLQVAQLRGDNLETNVLLSQPFAVPGYAGVNMYPVLTGKGQIGGHKSTYEYEAIKKTLNSIGQKLSSVTDNQILHKINKINGLETELAEIHQKINNYTSILRKNKEFIVNGKILEFDDINDLLDQYNISSKKQAKEMITLYSAFGKIKMLLEKENIDDIQNPKREPYFNI